MVIKFTESHEWIAIDGATATVGITDFLQLELGDIIFVELPQVGDFFHSEEESIVLETSDSTYDVYHPLSGTIVEINEDLLDNPELINHFPQGEGWLYKMTLSEPSEIDSLLDEKSYQSLLE